MSLSSLRITEMFLSIQGEANSIGFPTVFVRLTGCPLRCHYCDSEYAFYGGEKVTIDEIVDKVMAYGVSHVCVTGGEPLAQPNCLELLKRLCDKECKVSLETSGAMSVAGVDSRVSKVLDLKTPASGEVARNDYSNIPLLTKHDQVKFVICDREDYEWSLFKVDEHSLNSKVDNIFFSPSYEQLSAQELAEWILADKAVVRLQTQLHKALWGDKPGV
ncbi:MAG: 7-carboxy-7-deazaguanine synthase QueE [Cellvibrionaceae bacterium]